MGSINYNEFQPGQGVSAPALNENFMLINSAVENLEIELNSAKISIDTNANLKANKNGSSSEQFNVADATQENNAVSYRQFNEVVNTLNPIGTIIWFAGANVPNGYLLCDGSEVSRENYSKLFDAIGVVYGAGNSTTTFNLPKLTDDRFAKGSYSAGTYQDSNIAEHSHSVTYNGALLSGAKYSAGDEQNYSYATSQTATTSTVGSGADTYPKNLSLLPCIKY